MEISTLIVSSGQSAKFTCVMLRRSPDRHRQFSCPDFCVEWLSTLEADITEKNVKHVIPFFIRVLDNGVHPVHSLVVRSANEEGNASPTLLQILTLFACAA
jgi:hypothetical protein